MMKPQNIVHCINADVVGCVEITITLKSGEGFVFTILFFLLFSFFFFTLGV